MSNRNTKRPRKAYRARRVDADPVDLAISSAVTVPEWRREEIKAEASDALRAFRRGFGNAAHWARLAGHLNTAEALAARGIASDHLGCIESGQAVLAAVHGRAYGTHKSWTLRGPEITALDDAVFMAGVQLQYCSQGELAAATAEVLRRMDQALRGNAGAGVVVLSTETGTRAPGLPQGQQS